ncbi:bifunctional hydroxymethylpyrimidine kinase/phosphomethylpyrimidine kinase [Marinomonas algarum]|uniref:hydroxymethylpyrimidine kinase n=1 Tax=Marinomonas algarum TaxID=2883105 RepID=A0A9X1IKI2_9GAMM|nr:bifunctional hydroxymethylpyrimidine kinase/phosphomethylpyrimidine kinase [Marinomonas algarum]MCB5160880.1 bifunctional hydroxymethylpyrimidine kinase/phosphomethylpyrimidine kinase [Marinomonas algarum]
MTRKPTPITLTIAGSDSGGGAGIQADIKAISATGGYACSVITALTAQNTLGVDAIMSVEPSFVRSQLDSVFNDLDVRAVKIGMLSDNDVIKCVAQALIDYKPEFVVLDPVMVATSGDVLLDRSAVECLITELIPLATIITPNLYEAHILLNRPLAPSAKELPKTAEEYQELAEALMALNCQNVLLKGGHMGSSLSTDIWCAQSSSHAFHSTMFSAKRVNTNNTHGTGCTLSAAIASFLAQGYALSDSIQSAKQYISKAIETSDQLNVGKGSGPVNHFYELFQNAE